MLMKRHLNIASSSIVRSKRPLTQERRKFSVEIIMLSSRIGEYGALDNRGAAHDGGSGDDDDLRSNDDLWSVHDRKPK